MTDATLTQADIEELQPLVAEKAGELIELVRDADVATLERAVCLALPAMSAPDLPAEIPALFAGAFEDRGSDGVACLQAIELFAEPGLARMAARALERLGSPLRAQGLGTLRCAEAGVLRLAGADIHLLRLERPGDAAWQMANVIIERGEPALLVAATLTAPEAGSSLVAFADETRPPEVPFEPVSPAELAAALPPAAAAAAEVRRGVGPDTIGSVRIIARALGLGPEAVTGLSTDGGASALAIGPGDEEGYERLSEELLSAYEELHRQETGAQLPELDAYVATVMLDWKFQFGDADLGRWTEYDLAELLLEFVPRKVDVDDELLEEMPGAVARFLRFLDSVGVLQGAPCPELVLVCEDLAEAFADAVTDPANWGLAKSLFGGMAADGIDPSDPGEVDAWVAGFNQRSFEERDALLGPALGGMKPPAPRSRRSSPAKSKARRKAARASRKRNR